MAECVTARDRVWALTLAVARERERCTRPGIGVDTVAAAADERGLDTSERTIRRVLDAMHDLGALELTRIKPKTYRLAADLRPDASTSSASDATDTAAPPGDRPPELSTCQELSDINVGELPSPSDPDVVIYHLYADTGVEAEPLSAYGEVIRVGLEPDPTRFSHAVQGDALEPPLKPGADLVLAHPPCQRWSTATPEDRRDEHPDELDDAREVCRELVGDDGEWIIENVPEAPLRDPVVLSGRMFGLPLDYRRAFETSFPIPQPEERDQTTLVADDGPLADEDGNVGDWRGSKRMWRTIKQVTGDYDAVPLKHAGIPAPYIHYLARYWLRQRPELAEGTHVSADNRPPYPVEQ